MAEKPLPEPIKLSDALKRSQAADKRQGEPLGIFLAAGFEPLHLATFLKAHAAERLPDRPIAIETASFGDLLGNVARARDSDAGGVAVFLEWGDLDPRLAHRSLGGWGISDLNDILEEAALMAARLEKSLLETARRLPLVVSLPSLPLSPASPNRPSVIGREAVKLNRIVWDLADALVSEPRITLIGADVPKTSTPGGGVHDIKSELMTGFPYTLDHASALAARVADALFAQPRMKGLITDLDNTFWRGILGEDGPGGVAYSLATGAQMHGLYQQLLASLAESGALVAIASKNNENLVDDVFARRDMIFKKEMAFPVEVHWEAKSSSVARILKAWNIGADSVVFIDDSDIELAEVKAAFPEITCCKFPGGDDAAVLDLLHHLRDFFGTSHVSEEDRLRSDSLRASQVFSEQAERETDENQDFLARLDQRIRLKVGRDLDDTRAFELVNKTNQFNLNGRRYRQDEWMKFLEKEGAFMMTAEYEDKFGPLGKIAALGGERTGDVLTVKFWVMSCRAFSRDIEYACMRALFDCYDTSAIRFDYRQTERNQPLRRFLTSMLQSNDPGDWVIEREVFERLCPTLHHTVEVDTHG